MRQFFYLLVLLAVLLTAGCVIGDTDDTPAPPVQVVVTTVVTTSTPAPTSVPEEMAYLENVTCAMDQTSMTAYHCNGKIRIKQGVYDEVQVIARYPDNNTFQSTSMAMGGSNVILKSFAIFPDPQYQDREPVFLVKLDKSVYPVIMAHKIGIAYANLPPASASVASDSRVRITTAPPVTTLNLVKPITRIQPSANPAPEMTICGPRDRIYVPP